MSEPAAVVEVRDVHKDFDHGVVPALTGISLSVGRGEWVAVNGPSGCGKSTLLHLLAALDVPTSGTVEVFGEDLVHLRSPAQFRRTSVGLVFQLHNLLPQLTAAQNVEIAMFGRLRDRAERRERAYRLLAEVDLAGRESRPPTRLSGGERQRVAIARALANDPPLLLADEPTGNLDTASVDHVIELVQRLRQARPELTVIMVTHDPRVADAADRVVHMRDGRIVTGAESATG
ncbi:MAG TPA: ABC transporter ATP-binding protein [Jatrophihabitantaceae bacterium]|nr:ABC transporter ATP-binding protein [Jatrophihabitantaceae bacterium]